VNIDQEGYRKYAEGRARRSPLLKNCICAFLVGGTICTLGQLLREVYIRMGADKEVAGTLTSVSLIFLAALLTGLGVFDKIARVAGAGTLVPITGFANSVVSPAMDTKSEGFILGVGAKIFIISGPVILYGIFSGALYGVIYWLTLVM